MQRMEIYLNPVSQGDPLKAITLLPASTTIDETASPSLRGSSPDRSRVMLNGVPIYSPVKASLLNNQGFFSLFNPEIVDKQYVYASNPPLTYGNTSAGLVEVQTVKQLDYNQLQVSASLASAGLFLNQELEKGKSFVQVYGNYQLSDAFVAIQPKSLANIKRFQTKDMGINLNRKFGRTIEVNTFNYFVNENFSGLANMLGHNNEVNTANQRFFTVNNVKHLNSVGMARFSSGYSISDKDFCFGNIQSSNAIVHLYNALDYKLLAIPKVDVQFGVAHDYQSSRFAGKTPLYYFALAPEAPSFETDTAVSLSRLETYLYSSWEVSSNITFSSGLRFRIPTNREKSYASSQLGVKYRLSSKQWLLLSGGFYRSYTITNYYYPKFNLLSSKQLAVDYALQHNDLRLSTAVYAKFETGEQQLNSYYSTDDVETFGAEIFLDKELGKWVKVSLSNALIHQTVAINGERFKGEYNTAYLLKTSFQYNNPKILNFTTTFIARPGKLYTPVVASVSHTPTGSFIPIYSSDFLSEQFNNYARLDFSISRYFPFNSNALVVFMSINNVLNRQNERDASYNANYSVTTFDNYALRTIYFGLVWHINGKGLN